MLDRFWSKVSKVDGDACWEWTGAKFKAGYGALSVGSKIDRTKKAEYAHRISYRIHFGEIPAGLVHMASGCAEHVRLFGPVKTK